MKNQINFRNYFKLNKYVSRLPKTSKKNKFVNRILDNPDLVLSLICIKFLTFFKCLIYYSIELIVGGKYLIKLFFLKKNKQKKYAIVLGNGPSLDILKKNDLKKMSIFFDIFVVNNFVENKLFNSVIPNFVVFSDPGIFKKKSVLNKQKEKKIKSYLIKNKSINIFSPVLICKNLISLFGEKRVFGFIDLDARYLWDNTLPFFPRGYITATVLKAICLAKWIGYEKIFILGVDNTYPRDLFLNKKNNILNLENHASSKDYVFDMTGFYQSVSQVMFDFYKIFKDFEKVNKKKKIFNLDEYSLTGYDKTYNIQNLLKKINK